MFDVLGDSLAYLGDPTYWVALGIAIVLATAVGLIPGVGSTLVLAITLPIVIMTVEEPAIGIVMLAAITGTSNTFDSIPAQLMGIVSGGTQVTFLEGHQLARKGLGAYSMGAVYAVSAIGGVVGALFLLLIIPIIKPFILQVSFGDIAVLALFGILMVSILSHGAMLKGLVVGLLGLLIGTVGVQPYTGIERFTFGSYDLQLGLPAVAMIVGVMAMPEMIDMVVTRTPVAPEGAVVSTREVLRGFRAGLGRWRLAVRHSIFGAALGAIPGTGATVVTWLSYGMGIALTKGDRSEFGKGSLDGLLFAESAENAKEGGQALPTLVLGVPGSTSWLLVLVGLMAYGISPGPDILTDHGDVVGLIVVTFALANLILTVMALMVTRQLMRLTVIPYPAIGASVIPIVVTGAYFSDMIATTIPVLFGFTLVGLVLKYYGWPRPPLVLAFILGPIIEDNLFSAISIYGATGFIFRPLTIILTLVVITTVVFLQVSMNRVERETAAVVADAGVVPDQIVTEPVRRGSLRDAWAPDRLVPLGLLLIGIAAFVQAWRFPGEITNVAAFLPCLASAGIVVMSAAELVRQLRNPDHVQGQIMDLGMRSAGVDGSRRAALKVTALLALYLVLIYVVGIPYAGIVFAVLLPLTLMSRWKGVMVAAISAGLVALFIFGVGDGLFHVLWPETRLFGP